MQKDMILLSDGLRMKSSLKTTQPVNCRGLLLWAHLHKETVYCVSDNTDKVQCVCVSMCV